MKSGFAFLFLIAAAWTFHGCLKAPDYPVEPELEFLRISTTSVLQGGADTLEIVFGFRDGDGDIGIPANDTTTNVYLVDSRTGFTEHYFKVPEIPPGEDISGEISVRIGSPCCIFQNGVPCLPNPNEPLDTLRYLIRVKDRAGNFSNVIQTPPIVLGCN